MAFCFRLPVLPRSAWLRIAALIAAFLALAAAVTVPTQPVLAQERVKTVATFSILADLVKRVGGDRVTVRALVGPNGNTHAYTPTPDDARAVSEARLIFANGLGLEGWIERLVRAAGAEPRLVIVSRGVTALPARAADGHEHNHDHGAPDDHDDDTAGAVDPHAWQDIGNGKLYVAAIRDALIAADPAGRIAYGAQADAALAELDALDAEIRRSFAAIPPERRRVVTAHAAFDYFGRAYGIAFHASQGLSPDAESSAKAIAALIRFIRSEKIAAVFPENILDPRQLTLITRETGATIGGTLYSDALSPPDGPAPTYVALMRNNAREIARALVRTESGKEP